MNNFELLKQVFYNSKYDRKCDGHDIIKEKISEEKRKELGIKDSDIQKIIKKSEKYLYRVGKENGKFKYLSISIKNFELIRKYYKFFGEND